MSLDGLHVLLTYRCVYECSHCFLHCGPGQPGTFTAFELEGLLEQAATIDGLETVYLEGGEPMLYYPLLLHGMEVTGRLGLVGGIVTCGYYATTVQDAEMWLRPLKERGLRYVDASLDELHGAGEAYCHARNLVDAARGLGLEVSIVSVADPRRCVSGELECTARGEEPEPAMLRGRAAHELVDGLELHPISSFTECPHEDLEAPKRVHVDPYGNIHICQGVLAGSVWESSLAHLVRAYDPRTHPVLGPLLRGGPAALSESTGVGVGGRFASECHACYEVRRVLRRAPELRRFLGPNQVYGEEPEPPPDCYE